MMDSAAKSVLLRALSDKESPLFMSKSTEAVMEFMKQNGFKVKRPHVKSIYKAERVLRLASVMLLNGR